VTGWLVNVAYTNGSIPVNAINMHQMANRAKLFAKEFALPDFHFFIACLKTCWFYLLLYISQLKRS
jgi:hypothetical protein